MSQGVGLSNKFVFSHEMNDLSTELDLSLMAIAGLQASAGAGQPEVRLCRTSDRKRRKDCKFVRARKCCWEFHPVLNTLISAYERLCSDC